MVQKWEQKKTPDIMLNKSNENIVSKCSQQRSQCTILLMILSLTGSFGCSHKFNEYLEWYLWGVKSHYLMVILCLLKLQSSIHKMELNSTTPKRYKSLAHSLSIENIRQNHHNKMFYHKTIISIHFTGILSCRVYYMVFMW